MAKWLESIESAVGGGQGGPKRVKTLRWLLIVGGIGVALMILNSFFTFNTVEPTVQDANPPPQEVAASINGSSPSDSKFGPLEQQLEMRIKGILEKIVGVGAVDALITIDSTEEIVVERNKQESQEIIDESDRNGGRRHVTKINKDGQVVLYEVSGDQKPIVTKTINPRIRGILIVAEGAENETVRGLIVHAVEKGLSVPVNRISVVPSKKKQ